MSMKLKKMSKFDVGETRGIYKTGRDSRKQLRGCYYTYFFFKFLINTIKFVGLTVGVKSY